MQMEVLYQQGRVEFLEPIQLKHDQFRMIVELPDEEVVQSQAMPEPVPSGDTIAPSMLDLLLNEAPDDPWLQRMKAIEAAVLATPEAQLPDLTPKQRQYLDAFTRREDR
jgi:hypothetical protein